MALATQPRMLLLDEPMAGMGPEESARMVHDAAEAKARTDDPAGRARHGSGVRAGGPHHACSSMAASSRPARRTAIRADPEVRKAYLGEQEVGAWLTRLCSRLENVEGGYGLSQVLFGISHANRRG